MSAAEWTVMIFLNGDNNLEAFGLSDYREMIQVGSSEQVNVVVQFDRNGGYASTTPQWKGAYRFRVEKGVMATPAVAVESLGDTNMGSGVTLRSFVDWARQRYPAKRYMLNIWNHGQGWRFFRTVAPAITSLELNQFRNFRMHQLDKEVGRRSMHQTRSRTVSADSAITPLQAIPVELTVPSTVRYVSSDDTSNDVLYNREMQECLSGLKLDIIGFDACLMAMIETGYAMRGVADVMVGSQELEPGDGWNYKDWLGRLVADPQMDARDLGRALVRSYADHYAGNDEATTLSAVELKEIDSVADAVDNLCTALDGVSSDNFAKVIAARAACETYAPGYGLHGIDLAHFAVQAATIVGGAVAPTAMAVQAAVKKAVIENFAGEDRRGAFGSNGIGIYFPQRRSYFQADPDRDGYTKTNTHYPVEFVQTRRWSDFLVNQYLPAT